MAFSLYNRLFNNEIVLPSSPSNPNSNHPHDPSAWILAYYVPKHLGEHIDITLKHNALDEHLLHLQDKKIVGAAMDGGFISSDDLYVMQGEVANNISHNYHLYNITDSLLLKLPTYNKTAKLLKNLRYRYSMGLNSLDSIYDFGFNFYLHGTSAEKDAMIFFYMATASLQVTVMMLISLIAFAISARKRGIGILKALGCINKDLKKVFIFETLIIGVIVCTLSMVLVNLLIASVNSSLGKYAFVEIVGLIVDWLSYVIMVGMSIIFNLLITLIPLRNITKMKPIDAIKNL